MAVRKPVKRTDVHFVFRAHPKDERFMRRPLRKNTKLFIIEDSKGRLRGLLEEGEISRFGLAHFYGRNRADFLMDALGSGKKVRVGESAPTRKELKHLESLEREVSWGLQNIFYAPTLDSVKRYFRVGLKYTKLRHKLVRGTIKSARANGEYPIEARYGDAHSLLSRELAAEGIKSSREITPQVFDWESIVLRKLLLGKKPSATEYRKALIHLRQRADNRIIKLITGKEQRNLTGRDIIFFNLVETTLLDCLTNKQIKKIVDERNYGLLFTFNNLPANPTRRQLINFLKKKSQFYKMQLSVKRNKKELNTKKINKKIRTTQHLLPLLQI